MGTRRRAFGAAIMSPAIVKPRDLRVVANFRAVLLGAARIERAEAEGIDAVLVHRHRAQRSLRDARLDPVQLRVGEPGVRLAVLDRLVAVVLLEVALRAVDPGAVEQLSLAMGEEGHEEGNAE